MSMPLPSLFISHGAPDLVLSERDAVRWFQQLGQSLPRPQRIVVVSAHWLTETVAITASEAPALLYDFWGFPDPLYEVEYPCPGDRAFAHTIQQTLKSAGIAATMDHRRGLDHGAWAPLKMIFPRADIPVVQVSMPTGDLQQSISLARALAPLRDEQTLLVFSGCSVHNLRAMKHHGPPDAWAIAFEAWLEEVVEQRHFHELVDSDCLPAEFSMAHPTAEHYVPLIMARASADSRVNGQRLYGGFDYGNIGMSSFAFGESIPTQLIDPNHRSYRQREHRLSS